MGIVCRGYPVIPGVRIGHERDASGKTHPCSLDEAPQRVAPKTSQHTKGIMTTLRLKSVRCIVCGWRGEKSMIMSTSSFGPPGLDLRPAPPHGASVGLWVMDCPQCGYCAPDIGEPIEIGEVSVSAGGTPEDSADRHSAWRRVVTELIAGDPYRHPFEIQDDPLPREAVAHLRCGVLQHAGGSSADAGHSALWAAWVCDDHAAGFGADELRDPATHCRRAALGLFQQARAAHQPFASDRIHEELLLIDLLRRTGDFVLSAERLADLPTDIHDDERAIAVRQHGWIALHDRAAHHAQERPEA